MMPPLCSDTALDPQWRERHCSLAAGHDGDHMDWQARTWPPPGVVLQQLRETWGRTHRFAYLPSGSWTAIAHDPRAPWRTETEPTPGQLEESLRRHGYLPTAETTRSTP